METNHRSMDGCSRCAAEPKPELSSTDLQGRPAVCDFTKPNAATEPSFFRRPLPTSSCTDFSSTKGRKLFKEALSQGTMETFFSLASNFVTQNDPATCGLATMSMVLNSLEVDPDKIWKGPWRWYSEDMLDCCTPVDEVRKTGLILDDFACESSCNGADVVMQRVIAPEDGNWEPLEKQFRQTVLETSSVNDTKLVICYDRSVLHQTGTGHFSPIGGYHAPSDQVLILDVARFKYPPHWVPLSLVVKSMASVDNATLKSRGYVTMSRSERHMSTVLRISTCRGTWTKLSDSYKMELRSKVKENPPQTVSKYLELALKVIVAYQITNALMQYIEGLSFLPQEHQHYIYRVFDEIHQLNIYNTMKELSTVGGDRFHEQGYLEVTIIFILAQGVVGCKNLPPDFCHEIASTFVKPSLETDVGREVESLEAVLRLVERNCACGKGSKCSHGQISSS